MNSGLIARILAGGMALSILGVTLRYGSQYDSIQEGIEALKEKGVSFYNQYLVSEEAKNKLQDEFDTLKAQYLGVLDKLGLGENATLEDVQSKLEELAQGEASEVITDIAELLGIENAENATIDTITQAIAELEEAVTQLEGDIARLQTELEQANLDLAQANKEEEDTVTALNNALATLEALEGGGAPGAGEGEEGSEPGEPVGPPANSEPEYAEPGLTEQQALKATMDSAWSEFEAYCSDNRFYKTADIKQGNYTITSSTTINVAGKNTTVGEEFFTYLNAWEQAKTNYLNAGGTL